MPGASGMPGRGLLAPLVVLLLSACGLASCGASAGPSSGTAPPGAAGAPPVSGAGPRCGVVPGPGVTLTTRPGACAATAPVGATIGVVLSAGYRWGVPTSDAPAVDVAAVRRPPGGGLRVELQAVAPGEATVRAEGRVVCAPGRACPALVILWSLDVTVVPGGSSGA